MISWLEATLFPYEYTSAETRQDVGITGGTYQIIGSYTANESGATFENPNTTLVTTNSAYLQTWTTATYEEEISTTEQTTKSFGLLTTQTASTTEAFSAGTQSATTWTTATSSISATEPTTAYSTTEKTGLAVSTGDETVLANAFNTVYLAESTEVLYVAGSVPLSDYGGTGQTATTATRATRFAEVTVVPVIVIGTDAEEITATNESFSSSTSWCVATFEETTAKIATIGALPHSTTTAESTFFATTTTSHFYSRPEVQVFHNGDSTTRETAFVEVKTLSRYFGSSSFQDTYADSSVTTQITRHGGVAITSTNSQTLLTVGFQTVTLGTTVSAGGDTTFATGGLSLGVRLPASLSLGLMNPFFGPQWSVYGVSGAVAQGTTGLAYAMTQNLSFVSTIKVGRSADGMVAILPATNSIYTANETGLSWTTSAGTDKTTSSTLITVTDSAPTALFLQNTRAGLIGGNVGSQETAVQRVGRGVYQDPSGNTVFFEGHDTYYDSAQTVAATYYKPKFWLGPGGLAVTTAARNYGGLDFIPV